ncbi:hypothetical protein Tco_0568576 [Tanacetum coccineum]
MANLEFCDKHNMVAYLKKPSGSEGFQEIVVFINGSYIRYALTKNPTIYVSLIEKFWQTATVRTVDNGEQEINATVDGKEFTVIEESIRRHLQLADVDGISVLSTTEIFDQLSLMGYVLTDDKLTFNKAKEGEGSKHPSEPQPPPSTAQHTNEEPILSVPIPNVPDEAVYEVVDGQELERATNIATSLDAEQASGNINKTQSTAIPNTRSKRVPTPPCDSPLPIFHTLGTDEGSMTLQELTALSTTLSKKVESLEADLKKSKRRAKIVVSNDEEDSEDSSKQGRMIEEIDQDARVTLVTPTQGEDQPEDQLGVLSAAKIKEVNISIPSPVVVKDKGKGKMEESKDDQTKRTKLQQEQERLSYEVAVRLQEELDEEERQRMARVHEAAQSFTEEEWENIRARVEADEELSKRLQAEEMNKYSEVDQAKMLVDLINQRKKYFTAQKAEAKRNKPMTQAEQRNYMINYIKHIGSHILQQLKRYSFDEIKELFETTMKNVNTFVPMETEDKGRALEVAEAELDHEGSKRQKPNKASGSVQEQPEEEEKELSQEDLQQMMMVVLVEEVYVEALQVKYPIIDWEVYTEESRKYWKIIGVGNHIEAYQFFEDMLKIFYMDDLMRLWNLVKERFSSTEPTDDKERTLWVELKMLFEPNMIVR